MLYHHLLLALRSFSRNKAFTAINIFGLAIGLTTCMLILLYIVDEQDHDRNLKDKDRVYRVASISNSGETWVAASGPLAAAMHAELPEVEEATRLMTFPYIDKMLVKYNAGTNIRRFFETKGYYVDSNFFRVIHYNLKFGDPATALSQPNTLVISAKMAQQFFGKDDPIGKILQITTPFGDMDYTVRGVFDEKVNRSHIPANYFLSMHNRDMYNWEEQQKSWIANNVFFTYIKLKPHVDPKTFTTTLNRFHEQHAGADMRAAGFSKRLFLQPVKDIYLQSAFGNELAPNGNISYLYLLATIAIFILTIACINFMNLSTARSQQRAREVGVRKVLGAGKASLIRRFLGESFLLSMISLALALLLLKALLPPFNQITHKDLHLLSAPAMIAWIAALTIATGLIAGIYPAFYLSAFQPVKVLKGKVANSFSATTIRKGLVIFQFTVSICLIFAAIVIWQQLRLIENQDLGFAKEQQIVLPLKQGPHANQQGFEHLRNELSEIPGITGISSCSGYPGNPDMADVLFYAEGKRSTDVVDINLSGIETGYIKNLGLHLLSGREFSKGFASDSNAIILNETAVKDLGYTTQNAPGRDIYYQMPGQRAFHIIGVVKDFNYESLHHAVKPFGFTNGLLTEKYAYAIATIHSREYARIIPAIASAWTRVNPETPFEYSFLDQNFQHSYEKDLTASRIVIYFTCIAILIACLGLFGLAAFTAEQRTKEIGIRKVLGASVSNITLLLSRDFIRLVLLASIIATPIAWFSMHRWLQNFAYHIPITIWMFLAAGGLALAIAILTVSSHAFKAAFMNPARSLRSE